MRVEATGFGTPDVLRCVPSVVREPAAGEVAIRVRAAGVNHRDYKVYADPSYSAGRGQPPAFPLPLGVEAAGVVTAVGADAHGPAGPIAVGDEVIAYRIADGYADDLVAKAADVVPKPSKLTWEQAAALMLTGTTAAHALAAVLARPGQTVLIHAAGGSVGLAAVQLAVLDGIRVIGTGGPRSLDTIGKYGGVPVAHGDGLLQRVRERAPHGVDAALDFVGTDEAIDVSLAVVADRRRIATIVAFDRAKQTGIQAIGGSAGQDPIGVAIRNAARLRLTALAQAAAYDVPVAKTFPLAQAADAHRLLADGKAGGKIVLTV